MECYKSPHIQNKYLLKQQSYSNQYHSINKRSINMKIKLIIHISLLLLCLFNLSQAEQLVLKKVDRQLILNGNYPNEQVLVQFKSLQGTTSVFKHIVPIELDSLINKIAFMKNKDNKQMLPFERQEYIFDGKKYAMYKVQLEREYFDGQQGTIYIVTVFLNRYVNFPKQITMTQDQKFQFTDNKFFLTPYEVKEQSSSYKFDKLLHHDSDGEVKGLSTVIFRKSNAKPYSHQEHTVHGVNNDPQVYFSDVNRIIEVSHWGNIAITEFYKLKNIGPNHKGQFSRLEFSSRNQADAKHAFRGVESQLPYDTWGLYYRDQVGNVTTSIAYRDEYSKKVKLTLVPRFNLLGGWKCNWQVGYNLPTNNFLYNEGNHFQLDNINLEYSLEKINTENYDFQIILPEGATNVQVKAGGRLLEPTKIEKNFGYLDFFGRPVYVFEGYRGILKKRSITVDYHVDALSTLYKPFTIFIILFSLLAVTIVVKRLKFDAFKDDQKLE